ncbi:MAG TPA: hypothetical protein VK961_17020, partial [Chthoniobacter sp.]|nr:hypothetical protein [Chthoniobacter sp.]
KATRDKAKDEHLIFEQATSGKYRVLDKQVQELTDLLQANQSALATAPDDQKAALKKKGAEYEAKLAKLAQFKKQTRKINLLGVPSAIVDHVEAQEKVKEAREKLITAGATVTRLQNSIPVPKEVLEKFRDFNIWIQDCRTKVEGQEIAVANLKKALAGSTDDTDKKEIQAKLNAAESQLKKEQQELQRNIVGLDDYRESKRQQLEEARFEPERTALNTAREEEKKAEAAFGAAQKLVATKKQAIADRMANVTAVARAESDEARMEFDAAEKDLAQQNLDYEQAIAGHPELKKASDEMEAATKKTQQAAEAEKKALDSYAAAEQEAVAAEVLQQALKDRDQEAKAFAPFKHLKDADFETALSKGSDKSASNLFPEKPKFPGDKAKGDELKAYEKAQKEHAAKCAVITENLRQAQETMERMLARDEILEAAGASLEERKRAFGDMPPALLPKKFREELQAYREVEELFKIEDEHERIKAATREELKNSILKDLKGLAEVALPIIELFLDASCIVNNFIPVAVDPGEDATEDQKSAFETAEALKAKFEITRMVAEGLECFINTKEMLESENEMLEGISDSDDDEEKTILRQMKKDDKTAKMLAFMKDFIITTAKTTKGVLSMTKAGIGLAHNSGASEIAKTIGGVVPILGAVLDGIETAEAMYEAGKQIKMAYLENQIHKAAKKTQDEEALVNAYQNQSNRATNRAVKKSIHATAKAVQTTGSAVIAGGITSGAGAGVYAAGKAVEYGNKATFKAIDWAQAAQAQKTLEMARAGSYEAMTEIFADHQKYATMYIVMKAVKGDVKAQAFCATRSLDVKHLDSSTSLALLTKELKVARQEMLRKVEQTDEARTIQDSAGETFEKLARGGKAIGKLADMAVLGAGSKVIDLVKEKADELRAKKDEVVAVPEPEINEIKPINADGFLSLTTRADTILEKFNGHLSITEKDVQWRARWLMHLKDLRTSLDGDGDWKEAALKNEGGTIARVKIREARRKLQELPDKPTMEGANGKV